MSNAYVQVADTVLMVRPSNFGPNTETAQSNAFQHELDDSPENIQQKALTEFEAMTQSLEDSGIDVITINDRPDAVTYDSVFPNNWLSFHNSRRAVLYPMYSENRRMERRRELVQQMTPLDVLDLTHYEEQEKFLEGTGSMVLDRIHRIAYACRSRRTHEDPFHEFCTYFEYRPVLFDATDANGLSYYHTNVIMSMGEQFVVLCTESITNPHEILQNIEASGKELISISRSQATQFAGNILQLSDHDGKMFLVMSQTARNAFTQQQIRMLEVHGEILSVSIPTIEKYSGGSARCMMCEII